MGCQLPLPLPAVAVWPRPSRQTRVGAAADASVSPFHVAGPAEAKRFIALRAPLAAA